MPEYDFKTLSPSDFELLVRDLLAAEHSWRLEAFGHGRDGGVDLRSWLNGKKLVVQCKHYAGSTFSDLRAAARKELPKMQKERPDRYLFVTSQNLSRTQKDELASELSSLLLSPADLLIQSDINYLLGQHAQVERQHFKLWLASTEILDLIVRNGLWERSEALMEDIRDRVKLYVRSPGYERAAARLQENHVVVLTGVPGVGKSILAEMLLLAYWYEGWQVISLSSNIDEGWDTFRRNERQVFFFDDFLGQTDISERTSKNEDSRIVRFMDRVSGDPSKRLIMTTRSQILRQAALIREPLARGNFRLRECVVEIDDYGPLERARILYNHLYFSRLPRQVLQEFVAQKYYWPVVSHPNFSPRIIEQVLKREELSAELLAKALVTTLDRPIELWGTMFATVLSEVARRIVLTLVTFPVSGTSVKNIRSVARQEAQPLEFTHALRALEGTFIAIKTGATGDSDPDVLYANPSVRDFVLATLDEESEYIFSIISNADSLRQVLSLLEYAAAAASGELKFPKMARSIIVNQARVAEKVSSLIAHLLQEGARERYSNWEVRAAVIGPLAKISAIAYRLMPNHSVDMLEEAIKLNDEFRVDPGDAVTLQHLTLAVIAQAEGRIDAATKRVEKLVQSWSSALIDTEDIRNFADFVRKHEVTLQDYFDLVGLAEKCIEDALRKDIETMTDNRTDEDADNAWLDDIESVAREFGIGHKLSEDIEFERNNTADHYVEQEEEYPRSNYREVSYPAQEKSAYSDRSHIDGMFSQLS
ncbi:nSTAND3 domain-containing NTPase [Actinomadura opuntiae]|uniref:nSTAND3 domain-containing NTPase n=1 Tax=Actinomadura sp. OS1-43 TaxID=604315 RepID=UPI00255A8F26|nr:restriction endonuclease [Actinomadura sp. OS1-43]MDL4817747.1 restriction endonuclease [Actinomadura sp. OS1-43]